MKIEEEIQIKQKAQGYYEKDFSYNQVYRQGVVDGYSKAVDEFAKLLKEQLQVQGEDWELFFIMREKIDEIAKKMHTLRS